MDKGTHYYKADFQVHTPRDANWEGPEYITDAERLAYGKKLIKACREKSLTAIAITDHHDFCFFEYIKQASNEEVDNLGNPIPPEKRIIVFPGIEITLSSPPCQTILILDSDFDTSYFDRILTILGLDSIDKTISKLPSVETVSPSTVTGLNNLEEKLNQNIWLRGKFIIFPNVTDGGYKSIFRQGFAPHYQEMHCVGGYIDGDYSRMGEGKRNIVEGRQQNNGYKSIAVFQTSDNRKDSHADLGLYSSYIKLSQPTSEAIRQACLAKESRICLNQPDLPSTFLESIDVTNSKFLGSFKINFNNQYTSIIGGRGTGKSTILEYLRWGLCDQIKLYDDDSDQYALENRRNNLINNTLRTFNGEVRVTFNLNGIIHIVKRNSINNNVELKIGNGDFQSVEEEEIRKILPIQAYSQKQLSNVGVRSDELKRFIELPIQASLDTIDFRISDTKKNIRSIYNNYLRKKEIQTEIDQFELEIKSIKTQVEKLRSELGGLSPEEQEIIKKKPLYDNENSYINSILYEFENTFNKLEEFDKAIENYPVKKTSDVEIENSDLFDKIDIERDRIFNDIKNTIISIRGNITDKTTIDGTIVSINDKHKTFNERYNEAKLKATSNKSQLDQIQKLETRLLEITNSLAERNNSIKDFGAPENEIVELFESWFSLHKEKESTINAQAVKFTELSNSLIKAKVDRKINSTKLKSSVTQAFQGSRINESKVNSIFEFINSKENPVNAWKEFIFELKVLSESSVEDNEYVFPILSECNYNEGNITKLSDILDPDKWLMVATTEIDMNPEFKYTTNNDMGDEIPFHEASAGQQATALLTVLLNQEGNPLIIDQPEDDIDNRAIKEIIENIWSSKKRRQLIFSSHNANLVVNGDSELVVCCDYRESGNQTHGIIKAEGSIDDLLIKNEITSVMEGGEKAFKLRKEKYGF